jgi:DNA polymerase III gamma/tau subunit
MKAEVYIKPYRAARKVYIVPNADTVTVKSAFIAAQNSLLKVLEEPPEYCTIILLAENANSFLPTILSRATVIKFSPLDKDEYMRYLLSDEVMLGIREDILKYMTQLMSGKHSAAYELISYIKSAVKKDKSASDVILEIIGLFLNDLLHGRNELAAAAPQTAVAMLDVYVKYRKMINANGNFSACIELMILGILDEVRRMI